MAAFDALRTLGSGFRRGMALMQQSVFKRNVRIGCYPDLQASRKSQQRCFKLTSRSESLKSWVGSKMVTFSDADRVLCFGVSNQIRTALDARGFITAYVGFAGVPTGLEDGFRAYRMLFLVARQAMLQMAITNAASVVDGEPTLKEGSTGMLMLISHVSAKRPDLSIICDDLKERLAAYHETFDKAMQLREKIVAHKGIDLPYLQYSRSGRKTARATTHDEFWGERLTEFAGDDLGLRDPPINPMLLAAAINVWLQVARWLYQAIRGVPLEKPGAPDWRRDMYELQGDVTRLLEQLAARWEPPL
jgi:hypothetical protein